MGREVTLVPRYNYGRDPIMSLGTSSEFCPSVCPLRHSPKEEGELYPKCHLAYQNTFLSAALVTMCEARVPFLLCPIIQETSLVFSFGLGRE